jgi:hypothetical protein
MTDDPGDGPLVVDEGTLAPIQGDGINRGDWVRLRTLLS